MLTGRANLLSLMLAPDGDGSSRYNCRGMAVRRSCRPGEETMLAILLPCGGGPEISILSPTVTLGRYPDCDVRLEYRSISGRHCELRLLDGFWRVCDLGSSNGTRINGNPVTLSWLFPDDELTLGKERFYLIYIAPEGARPPPLTGGPPFGRKPQPAKGSSQRRTTARA